MLTEGVDICVLNGGSASAIIAAALLKNKFKNTQIMDIGAFSGDYTEKTFLFVSCATQALMLSLQTNNRVYILDGRESAHPLVDRLSRKETRPFLPVGIFQAGQAEADLVWDLLYGDEPMDVVKYASPGCKLDHAEDVLWYMACNLSFSDVDGAVRFARDFDSTTAEIVAGGRRARNVVTALWQTLPVQHRGDTVFVCFPRHPLRPALLSWLLASHAPTAIRAIAYDPNAALEYVHVDAAWTRGRRPVVPCSGYAIYDETSTTVSFACPASEFSSMYNY